MTNQLTSAQELDRKGAESILERATRRYAAGNAPPYVAECMKAAKERLAELCKDR